MRVTWPDNLDAVDEQDKLVPATIVEAINKLANRVNYGYENSGIIVPNLAYFKWEVEDISPFPQEIQEIILSRRCKRNEVLY